MSRLPALTRSESQLSKLYREYEETQKAFAAHHAKHRALFDADRAMRESISTMEEKIKTLVRGRYVGKPSGAYEEFRGNLYTISVVAKYHREIDAEGLLLAAPILRQVAGVVETSINKKRIEGLISAGEIAQELVTKFTHETQATSAVSFLPTKEE